jgi:hypothetical protein
LFRILVTWSAIEQYVKVTKMTPKELDDLLTSAQHRDCLGAIRKADEGGRFFVAVGDRTTDKRLAREVAACIDGRRDSVVPVVKAVRHAFAHGDLAPGANSAKPGVAQKVAAVACPLLLTAVNKDFTRRVLEVAKGG